MIKKEERSVSSFGPKKPQHFEKEFSEGKSCSNQGES
jgi:hypothetical protein